MPFASLSVDQQNALLARLERKGLTRSAIQKTDDLVVKPATEIKLSAEADSAFKPVIRKPASLKEAQAWLGQREIPTKHQELCARRLKDVGQIQALVKQTGIDKIRATRTKPFLSAVAENPQSVQAFSAAAYAAVYGMIDIKKFSPVLQKEITNLVVTVPVLNWTFTNVVVKAGGTLKFSAPGPHTFIAHSLVVEHGGKIVAERCHVDFDCEYMEFQ